MLFSFFTGTTVETVTVTCIDGYNGGGTATCGTNGQFNTLTCAANTCTCPYGTTTVASGSGGTLCEADSTTDCSACRAGYTLSASAGTGSQTCIANTCTCPNGTPTTATGSGGTLCETASTIDCSACTAGYRLSALAGTGLQTCAICPVATFSTISDATECTECVRGTCSAAGSQSCATCAALPDDCKGITCDHTSCNRSCGIRQAVDDFLSSDTTKRNNVIRLYGLIQDWDVTQITDMAGLFYNKTEFNSDLSRWITSNVTNMARMFAGASKYNKDLSATKSRRRLTKATENTFSTSKVTTMKYMFYLAKAFNGDISNFDTSNVLDMGYMFQGAANFNNNVSSFNTSSVTSMSGSK